MKKENPLDILRKKANEYAAKNQFEYNAKLSLSWILISFEHYRTAEWLYTISAKAHKLVLDKNLISNVFDLNIPEHARLDKDSKMIRNSYFFLGRAIELLLKGLLIEQDENYFFIEAEKGHKAKLDMEKLKPSHDLLQLAKNCNLNIQMREADQLKRLSSILIWETFPIPLKEKDLLDFYNNSESSSLDVKNYPSTSTLFDKILFHLNEKRKENGKSTWNNIYKLS